MTIAPRSFLPFLASAAAVCGAFSSPAYATTVRRVSTQAQLGATGFASLSSSNALALVIGVF